MEQVTARTIIMIFRRLVSSDKCSQIVPVFSPSGFSDKIHATGATYFDVGLVTRQSSRSIAFKVKKTLLIEV